VSPLDHEFNHTGNDIQSFISYLNQAASVVYFGDTDGAIPDESFAYIAASLLPQQSVNLLQMQLDFKQFDWVLAKIRQPHLVMVLLQSDNVDVDKRRLKIMKLIRQ
jgi:hypothetical protein